MEIRQLYLSLLAVLLSSFAVITHNQDLTLTRDTQPANILNLQSEELYNLPAAEQKPVIAVYQNSFQD